MIFTSVAVHTDLVCLQAREQKQGVLPRDDRRGQLIDFQKLQFARLRLSGATERPAKKQGAREDAREGFKHRD